MIFRPDSRRYDYHRFGLEWPWDHLGQCSFPIFDRLLKTRKQMRAIFSYLNDNINVKIVFNFYKLFLSSFTTSVGLKPATVSFTVMNTVYTSHTRSLKEPSIIPAFNVFLNFSPDHFEIKKGNRRFLWPKEEMYFVFRCTSMYIPFRLVPFLPLDIIHTPNLGHS